MATRKIRLTLSGTQVDGQGPIVDVDFNGVNQDADLNVTAIQGSATIVREYTVDVDAGTYNLDVNYKNDAGDRNLCVDKIEIANDGTNYTHFEMTTSNTSVEEAYLPLLTRTRNPDYDESQPQDYDTNTNLYGILNDSFDPAQTRTDRNITNHYSVDGAGSNSKYQYHLPPLYIYVDGTTTFNITFS